MFKTTLSINQETDMGDLVQELLARGRKSKMGEEELDSMEEQFRLQIETLLERGVNLYHNGSQMKVDTVVKGQGFNVSVKANFGTKVSIWGRILGKG